jgi:hypothetical protein
VLARRQRDLPIISVIGRRGRADDCSRHESGSRCVPDEAVSHAIELSQAALSSKHTTLSPANDHYLTLVSGLSDTFVYHILSFNRLASPIRLKCSNSRQVVDSPKKINARASRTA